jgi:hypothetical protein
MGTEATSLAMKLHNFINNPIMSHLFNPNRQIEAAHQEIVNNPLVFKVKQLIVNYLLAKILHRDYGSQASKSRMIDLQLIGPFIFDSLQIEPKLRAGLPKQTTQFLNNFRVNAST